LPGGAIAQSPYRTNHIRGWSSKAATNFITTEHTENTEKEINHETHKTHEKEIVNFLLRKNLTIDFVKNMQEKQKVAGWYYRKEAGKSFRKRVREKTVFKRVCLCPSKTRRKK
jgi:carbonic anhydrase